MGKAFAYNQTQKIENGPIVSNFNLFAHLFGWKWVITRDSTHEVPGQISRSPKGTKANVIVKYFVTLFNCMTNYYYFLSYRQSPIYSGFLFATAQVKSLTAMIFFAFISLITYLIKIPPVKRCIKMHCFCSLVQKGEHAFHVFTVKRIKLYK